MTSESISFFHVLTLLFADTGVEQMTKLYQVVMEIRDEQTNIRNEQKEMRDEQKELAKKVPTVTLLTDLTPSDASTRKGGEIGVLWRALGLPDAAVEIPGEPYKSDYSMRKFSFSWAGKSLEKEGYDALKEHLGSNGFSDIHCVEAGERLVSGELFDVNVFELRKKLGSHGEPLIARVSQVVLQDRFCHFHKRRNLPTRKSYTIAPYGKLFHRSQKTGRHANC